MVEEEEVIVEEITVIIMVETHKQVEILGVLINLVIMESKIKMMEILD